ncbi:MAG: aromatic amino acid transport family protein [Candidatus Aenigmatarchaeota archaeon]
MNSEYLTLIYLILSTMIGAGILALPYAFYNAGIINSLFLFFFSMLITYISAKIILNASLKYYSNQLPEIINRYLGKFFGTFFFISFLLSLFFVNIAYLNVINFSVKTFYSQSESITLLIAAIVMSISFVGFWLIEKSEKLLFTIKTLIYFAFLSFVIFITPKYDLSLISFNLKDNLDFLLISIFAFSFYSIIPSLLLVSKDKKVLRNSFIISLVIAFSFYFLFAFIVSSRVGNKEIATLNFNELFNILTLFLVITPYIILSWVMSETIAESFEISKRVSLLLSYTLPFIFFLLFPKSFLSYIEITSGFFILSNYFIFGYLGYKLNRRIEVNKLESILLMIISIILIFYEAVNLIL